MLRNGVKLSMLVVFYLAAFASAFNENIMNVALVSIAGEFSVDAGLTQWLVTGYMIVTSVIIAVSAFLLERFSMRALFFVAGVCLVAGEAICFAAPVFSVLLVGRLLQAVASGLFIPIMMGTVLACSPREKIGTYLSIGSAAITIGPAVAPVESGIAVTLFGWRSIFVFPAVFVLALVFAAIPLVKDYAPTKDAQCDVLSVVLAALGLTLLVYGLGELTANLPVAIGAIAAGIAVVAWFSHRQLNLESPVLDIRPMTRPRFVVACLLVMVSMMTTFSMSVLLPLYYEGAFAFTALLAGLLILPPIIVNALTAILAGRLMDRAGEWPLLPLGFACIVIGQALIAAIGAQLSLATVMVGSVIVYAGVGLVMSPSQTSGLRILPPELNASGVAIVNVLLMVAASIGPSLFVGILTSGAAANAQAGEQLAQAAGFSQAVTVAAVIAAVGFVISVPYARRASAAAPVSQAAEKPDSAQPEQAGTIAQVMERNPSVVAPGASMREVLGKLTAEGVGGVVVADAEGHVAGFLSDGDVMRALSSGDAHSALNLGTYLAAYENDEGFSERVEEMLSASVTELATPKVVCAHADASLQDACDLFYEHHLKRLPVIDSRGKLVGLLNRKAISRYLMREFLG